MPAPAPMAPPPIDPQAAVAAALADQPFDRLAALPPAPIPGGQLTPEQLAAAAVSPPPRIPMTTVDAALAQAPPSPGIAAPPPAMPPAGAAPPPPPPVAPTSPLQAAEQNAAGARAIGAEGVANAEERAGLDAEVARETARFKAEQETRLKEFQQEQLLHRQAADAMVSERRSKAESEPYHSLWESRTNAQDAAIALGMILGGISWNPAHVNRGTEMLQRAMEREDAMEKQRHADLWKAMDEAVQGRRDLDHRQLTEVHDWQAREGARWDAIAGRLNAMIAANKGRGDVTAAKKAALEADEKATAAWQNAASAEATAQHMKAMERIAMTRGKKSGAGGGGGSGGAVASGAEALANEIQAGIDAGTPLTPAQEIAAARRLKVPIIAKAGQLSLKTIRDEFKNVGAEGLKGNRADEAKAQHVLAEMDAVLKPFQKDVADPLKHGQRALDVVKKDPNDPLNWVHLVDGMIRSNTGRAAIMSQYNLFMGHAAGATDKPEQILEKLRTGKPSPAQQEAIVRSAEQIVSGLRREAKDFYENFRRYDEDERITGNQAAKRGYVARERNAFGTLPGYGGKEPEAAAPAASALPPGAIPGTKTSTGQRGYWLNGAFTAL